MHGQLTGIRGLPVEGHDIVAGVEIIGTKQIDFPRIRGRLRSNGADLRLGLPLEKRSRPIVPAAPLPSPAERCSR
jgi:hypothetical protein